MPNKFYNLSVDELIEHAVSNKEGVIASNGALSLKTGKFTGRAPKDKFIVDTPAVHNDIAWGKVNRTISLEKFNAIKDKVLKHLESVDNYIFQGYAGADPKYRLKFKVVNELASQNLFIHQLLVRPTKEELEKFGQEDYVIYVAPNYKCDPAVDGTNSEAFIGLDYEHHVIVIAGSAYSGEIKKSVFSTMNFVMPKRDVLPMHCSANVDPKNGDVAIFFGLSGTGKTTLSADPNRLLIGDDEHGWSKDGVFNFEGGCYAKCINLTEENEPDIYHAIKRGAVMENVILNDKNEPDYFDNSITENTRVGYPVDFIKNAKIPSVGGVPKVIIFLTADAFGVLPPVSKLSKEAAMYHFITGFTSKVAGTEEGVKQPEPTFSTLFGEPFMPLSPFVYANMLGERIDKYGTQVYLVNTGWAGGTATSGASRIKLRYTRNMVSAILDGSINKASFKHDPIFNLEVPTELKDVPTELLSPKDYWSNKKEYEETANKLAKMFEENFKTKYPDIPDHIRNAGPKAK